MADYKDGDVTWQGFLRPYRDAQEAKAVFEKYLAGVKKDGAEVKTLTAEGADEMVISTNIGLVDVVFRKGNTLAGANGATSAAPAEAFARALAKSLPATRPDARKQSLSLRSDVDSLSIAIHGISDTDSRRTIRESYTVDSDLLMTEVQRHERKTDPDAASRTWNGSAG